MPSPSETHPHFAFVALCADEGAVAVYRQIIVNFYSSPRPIDVELNNVFPLWIIDWCLISVLRKDVVADEFYFVLVLELVMRSNCQT